MGLSDRNAIRVGGEIAGLTFRSEDGSFVVARLTVDKLRYPGISFVDPKGQIYIVGDLGDTFVGDRVEITGEVTTHHSFGRQVKVHQIILSESSNVGWLRGYLTECVPLLGPVLAGRIVDHFGAETLTVLDENPQRLHEVEGIGRKRAKSIIDRWPETRALRKVQSFLSRVGISTSHAQKFIDTLGEDADEVIREDPYLLARLVRGFGFKKSDEVAMQLGVPEVSDLRLRAALEHTLWEASGRDGHVFLYEPELIGAAVDLLAHPAIHDQQLRTVLQCAVDDSLLVAEENRIYLPEQRDVEREVAESIRRLMGQPAQRLNKPMAELMAAAEHSVGFELHTDQRRAVELALLRRVSVMTGGPGVGKTQTTRAVVAAMAALSRPVLLLAPTGRAAKRLSELTRSPASTIHRELFGRMRAVKEGTPVEEAQFHHCSLIVDEVSMVDQALMAWLLRFCGDDVSILFVGDPNQLPSIGAGAVLRDLVVASAVPTVTLTHIFRQAEQSMIVKNAYRMQQGAGLITVLYDGRALPDSDMIMIFNEETDRVAESIVDAATTVATRWGFNPMADVQVLTPKRQGPLGVELLNQRLQQALNPSPPLSFQRFKDGDVRWGVGDRIMQIKNNYDLGLFNGDVGTIQDILWEPGKEYPRAIVVEVDGYPYEIKSDLFSQLTLAYAITAHKSQGGQFPMTVLCLHTTHSIMLQRTLAFTAITRAEHKLVLCGNERAVSMAAHNDRTTRRNTYLAERIAALTQERS